MPDNNVNLRRVAFDIVSHVLENGKYLTDALADTLRRYQYLEKNKRSYISRISRGVVERFIELDAIISTYSTTKINKLNPNIRNILRMAVYELRYMDAIPESATVNEYVKLSSKKAPSRLKGFVNGILRNMIRDEFEKVSLTENEIFSMPKWLYDKFDEEYGCARDICSAFLDTNLITIRTNLTKCTPEKLKTSLEKEGIKVNPIEDVKYGFYIEDVDYLNKLNAFKDGLFYVQDLSSMMVGEKTPVKPGDIVLDVCAAPGGKSLHIAELLYVLEDKDIEKAKEDKLTHKGHVFSYDISEEKVNLIRDNIDRTGLSNITAEIKDARVLDEKLIDKADIVIADLPCSGLGIIGKKPDIKSRINKKDIESLSLLQKDILNICKNYVKPCGTLIYSTCTISRAENQDNVRTFLESNGNFSLVEETQFLPDKKQDGFYIAVMKRNS